MKNLKQFTTISEVEEYRNSVNEECNKRIEYITKLNEASDLSEKKFGYIKEAYESLSPMLFKTNEGRNLLSKYTSMIKENKNLKAMHGLYESLRRVGNNSDIDFFVNHMADSININENEIRNDVNKLGKLLSEAYILLGNECKDKLPTYDEKFHSAVEYVTENKKSANNLSTYSTAIKIIKDKISQQETNEDMFNYSLNESIEDALKSFNNKYNGELNSDEISVLKEIGLTENKVEIFNKYKNLCEETITNSKKSFELKNDKDSLGKIQSIQEQISKKEYSNDTLVEDVYNFIEITKILKEE